MLIFASHAACLLVNKIGQLQEDKGIHERKGAKLSEQVLEENHAAYCFVSWRGVKGLLHALLIISSNPPFFGK